MTIDNPRASPNSPQASFSSSNSASIIHTPPSEDQSQLATLSPNPPSRRSPSLRSDSPSPATWSPIHPRRVRDDKLEEGEIASDLDPEEDEEVMAERPPLHRPTDGRSQVPLLKDEHSRPSYDSPNGSTRPSFAPRRSTFRSRSPELDSGSATRRKYTYAAFFLVLSLVSFVIQTETAVYIQHELKWNKAYCML